MNNISQSVYSVPNSPKEWTQCVVSAMESIMRANWVYESVGTDSCSTSTHSTHMRVDDPCRVDPNPTPNPLPRVTSPPRGHAHDPPLSTPHNYISPIHSFLPSSTRIWGDDLEEREIQGNICLSSGIEAWEFMDYIIHCNQREFAVHIAIRKWFTVLVTE